jgi:hypothetical protein
MHDTVIYKWKMLTITEMWHYQLNLGFYFQAIVYVYELSYLIKELKKIRCSIHCAFTDKSEGNCQC